MDVTVEAPTHALYMGEEAIMGAPAFLLEVRQPRGRPESQPPEAQGCESDPPTGVPRHGSV